MHCPACDKEFSPVHSRCPDCNGWLRTKPGSGAKPANGSRPTGEVSTSQVSRPTASALAGPAAGIPAQAAPVTAANVTLPTRPSVRPPAPPAPTAQPAAAGPGRGPTPQAAQAQLEAPSTRGALGSGWETSESFPAPTTDWPGASNETLKMQAFGRPSGNLGDAPTQALGGLGAGPSNAFGAPAAPAGGLGGPASGFPGGLGAAPGGGFPTTGGLGAAPGGGFPTAGGLGSGPPSGSLGAPPQGLGGGNSASWGSPASVTPQAGWLGGEAAPANPRPTHSWGGDKDSESSPAVSMPSAPPVASGPVLSLPDHTVMVDLEGGLDDDFPQKSGGSNKLIYIVLACLLIGLLGFVAYIHKQNGQLKQPTKSQKPVATTGAFDLGMTYFKSGQQAYQKKKWDDAQQNAELARDLIVPLKVAPPAKVKEVKKFFEKATTRCALALFEKAGRARQAGDSTQAIAYCDASAAMYAKLPKTGKEQARAFALQGQIFETDGDSASAERAYRKAHALNPGQGYAELANRARQRSGASSQPVDTSQPQTVVEQPSLGGNPSYPTGSGASGYRPSSGGAPSQPAPADPGGSAPKTRPVNTYVPPRKVGGGQRKSDVLPTYNH